MGRVGVIGAVAFATLALAAPAAASRLAYSAGSPSQVFTVGPNGAGTQQITHEAGGAAHPDWSPDGRLVAYDVGGRRIAVSDASGGGERVITLNQSGIDPVWSPDSSQLAFTGVEYDENGNPETTSLYVTQVDGSNYVRIGNGSEPDWSPKSNWIVYRSNPANSDGCPGVWRMRSDGSDDRAVAPGYLNDDGSTCSGGGADPSFAPNGKRVVFVSADGTTIFTTSLYGGRTHRVVGGAAPKSSPVFSPDGRWIAYSTADGLWKVRAKGGKPKRIAASGGPVAWQP